MKRLSSLSRLLLLSVCCLPLTNAHALGGKPGGPSSNGSYFANEGTFSAVVRGENLTGTVLFSTTSGSGTDLDPAAPGIGVGSTGVATIYFDGDTFQGNSQGAYNPHASTLAVNFQADIQGQGEQVFSVETPVTVDIPNVITENGTTTVVETQETTFQATREVTYFDSLYLNGAAVCKTTNAFPNQVFKGKGEAEFQQLVFAGDTPFLDALTIPISINGVRVSDTASDFATADVRPPSVNEISVLVE